MKKFLSTSVILISIAIWSSRDCLAQHSYGYANEGQISAGTLAEMGLGGMWELTDAEASCVRGCPGPPPQGVWLVGLYNRFLRYSQMTRSPQISRAASARAESRSVSR
jgi:hypothetical protein